MAAEEAVYLFSELTAEVKASALEKYRDWNVSHGWWDYIYQDAKDMAAKMGITIEDISFSGFWSQGDGASFTGGYKPQADAVEAIKAECNDEALIDFAERLTATAVSVELSEVRSYTATIKTSGNYCHSGTMSIEVEAFDSQGYAELPAGAETELLTVFREFADWIYKALQAEHEYLTSDECLSEQFREAETKFTEDGAMI